MHTNIKELKNCHLGIISMKIKISKVDIKSGFLSGTEVKIPPANAGDEGLIPGSGRYPGEGNGNPLHYSCLGNPMVRGAGQAMVHGIAIATIKPKPQPRRSNFYLAYEPVIQVTLMLMGTTRETPKQRA